MPSPTIPRFKPVPNIPEESQETHLSPSSHSSNVVESNTIKPCTKKLGQLLAAKDGSSFSKNPQVFSKENEARRYTSSSLAINRGKVSSPTSGVETNAANSNGSSSSKSSFVGKMQEWISSCFRSRGRRSSLPRSSWNRNPLDESIAASSASLRAGAITRPKAAVRKIDADSKVTDRKPDATSSAPPKTTAITRPEGVRKTDLDSETKEGKLDAPSSAPLMTKAVVSVTSQEGAIRISEADSGSTDVKPTDTSFASSMTEADVSIVRPEATVKTIDADLEVKEVRSSKQQDNTAALSENEKSLGEKETEEVPLLSNISSNFSPIQPAKTHAERVDSEETSMPENERRFIWADKYRPSYLKNFLCNQSKALELQAMARSKEFSHYIFEGSPGVGKRTMIWALLREIFGHNNLQAREECKEFYLKGEAVSSINVNVKVSPNHVEVNLSELRGYEKHVIVQLINEKSNNDLPSSHENCKAIILYGADKLPSDAMVYIRWLLERYKGSNKVFFCCNDASKLYPVKPVCKVIQLLRPSIQEIVEVLEFIAKQEGIVLPQRLAVTMANISKNNLRQAIRSFEATWHFNSLLKEDQEILTGWEDVIANVAANITEEQSPRQLYIIRGKLQNLFEHNVSPEFIFKMLVEEIKKKVDEEFQQHIDQLHRKYNTRDEEHAKRDNDQVRETIQQFMKIEEFIARFMSWYKSLILQHEPKRPGGDA